MGFLLSKSLDWLDSRASWQFLSIFYVARWVLIVPYMIGAKFLFTDAQISAAGVSKLSDIEPALLFANIVIIGPLLETLLECSLPFLLLSHLQRDKGKPAARPWLFVVISALLMVVFHPMLAAIVPSFITGVFLAYCYAHFASRGFGYALLYTTGFHGAINVVGWTMIVLSC
jgi:hypothetical protein